MMENFSVKPKNQPGIFWLILLPLLFLLLFGLTPLLSGLLHMFCRWDGGTLAEFSGIENFRRMWNDSRVAQSLLTILSLVTANGLKMVVPISAAVVLNRIVSRRAAAFYRIILVLPMALPVMVTMLMWKYF